MGDSCNLEKMGRELKCPICLSLLNSAVTLLCNHVFCNSCITKSMKSGSSCPVCKVPYSRREVRPAPHMDNLVCIYKNMETASGMTIFVTQNAPTAKLSDENQHGNSKNKGQQNAADSSQDVAVDRRTYRGKGSSKAKNSNMKKSGPVATKPSCPKKKRVQVPQYPLEETPTCPVVPESCIGEGSSHGCKQEALKGNGELVLSPFFWIREVEDNEKLTQISDHNHITDTTPPDVPSFSDIKDSDDELPDKAISLRETNDKPRAAEIYDSEMFEWTQRPCSPELCASPSKMEIDATEKSLKTLCGNAADAEKTCTGNGKPGNFDQDITKDDVSEHKLRCGKENGNNRIKNPKLKKRGRNVREKSQCKSMKSDESQAPGAQSMSEKVSNIRSQELTIHDDSLTVAKKSSTGKKTACSKSVNPTSGDVSTELLDGSSKTIFSKVPAASIGLKKTGKKYRTDISPKEGRQAVASPITGKLGPMDKLSVPKEPIAGQQTNKHRALSSISTAFGKKSSIVRKDSTNTKKMMPENILDNGELNASTEKVTASSDVRLHCGTSTLDKHSSLSTKAVLRKCKTVDAEIRCAFCDSPECSKASGEMVHYCDGKPVPFRDIAGARIIHVHKNCAEWAPNVYFEDNNAINLEAELARSKRIKCSCCGTRGAALGCYEKSCRKSFHVTCAKMTPQCRWDNVNFVMLCPLHVSSKLPCESSRSREATAVPAANEHKSHEQVTKKYEGNTGWNWISCGSRDKIVLCCSALSATEREIVSKFARSSRATVLQKWDSSVTHVIASTDENGACKRTLKVLMGILEGKWILSIDWVKECVSSARHVDEDKYEITSDIYGMKGGPRLGRLRVLNKQPKLFAGLKFYFMGDFVPSYKGYLEDLIVAAGGTVLHRKPVAEDGEAPKSGSSTSSNFVIYSTEMPDKCSVSKDIIIKQRQTDAEALASSTGAKVASNTWLLNSISASKLQCL